MSPLVNTIYSQVVTLHDVEQAVISQLRTWIPACLAEVERQAGIAPGTIPSPPDAINSFTGGIDFNTWSPALTPVLITVVQPVGEPEREYGNGTYLQTFEIQVATIVQEGDEDTSRAVAQFYGAAVMMALVQHGSLGTFSQTGNQVALKTVLAGYPHTIFPDPSPNARRVVRSEVTVHSLIDQVVTETAGPATPPSLPYQAPGDWPEVTTVATTVT